MARAESVTTGIVREDSTNINYKPPTNYNPKDTSELSLKDIIKFNGGLTGNFSNFQKLNPVVQAAFIDMAKKYFEVYGKPLTVTSAFRTPEEQAQISSGTNAKAEPGQSLHQRGMAIDVDRNDLKRLVDSQLLTAYGFSSIANDNVHMQYGRPPEGYNGGIFSGPLSGYLIKAHGDELITP